LCLFDKSIESYLDDKLSFETAVTTLKELIDESDTPISIGINGKWGSGKTSMMRLIKEKLEKDGEVKISWFDTWNYANEKEIWRVLMISLIDDLDPKNKNSLDNKKIISSILNIGHITYQAWLSQGMSLYSDKDSILEIVKNISN
jgi:predicted KAP-like P-loop ATPase